MASRRRSTVARLTPRSRAARRRLGAPAEICGTSSRQRSLNPSWCVPPGRPRRRPWRRARSMPARTPLPTYRTDRDSAGRDPVEDVNDELAWLDLQPTASSMQLRMGSQRRFEFFAFGSTISSPYFSHVFPPTCAISCIGLGKSHLAPPRGSQHPRLTSTRRISHSRTCPN